MINKTKRRERRQTHLLLAQEPVVFLRLLCSETLPVLFPLCALCSLLLPFRPFLCPRLGPAALRESVVPTVLLFPFPALWWEWELAAPDLLLLDWYDFTGAPWWWWASLGGATAAVLRGRMYGSPSISDAFKFDLSAALTPVTTELTAAARLCFRAGDRLRLLPRRCESPADDWLDTECLRLWALSTSNEFECTRRRP